MGTRNYELEIVFSYFHENIFQSFVGFFLFIYLLIYLSSQKLFHGSVFNSEEVSLVISYVKDLLRSKLGGRLVTQNEIGIVTPYRLQRQKIHEKLQKNGWPDVAVGTVETFQGQERDVIIMSTVRSVLYQHNGRFHIGFLSNPKVILRPIESDCTKLWGVRGTMKVKKKKITS